MERMHYIWNLTVQPLIAPSLVQKLWFLYTLGSSMQFFICAAFMVSSVKYLNCSAEWMIAWRRSIFYHLIPLLWQVSHIL